MKKLLSISFVFFIVFSTSAFAQSYAYSVGETSLNSIDVNLVSLSFQKSRPMSGPYYIEVNYGQECITQSYLYKKRKEFLQKCLGLVNDTGELVEVDNYLQALNLMERLGWKFESVVERTNSEGSSGPMLHHYIFRRQGDSN